MTGKLCLYCAHFYMDCGAPWFSEVTPGDNFDMTCGKRHWKFDPQAHGQEDFKRTMETGLTCVDFEERG